MIIKIWNSFDMGVFEINPRIKYFYKEIEQVFSEKERKQLKEITKIFAEEMTIEFVHNLKKGWENKLLKNGVVSASKNGNKLFTKEEIRKYLAEKGQINFSSRKKNGSCKFIKTIRKPPRF